MTAKPAGHIPASSAILPFAVAQCVICYIAALCLGLELTINILYAVLLNIPVAVLFIALGLLCGSVFTDKQAGGAFKKIAYAPPFIHAVKMERAVLNGRNLHNSEQFLFFLRTGRGFPCLPGSFPECPYQ